MIALVTQITNSLADRILHKITFVFSLFSSKTYHGFCEFLFKIKYSYKINGKINFCFLFI